MAEAAKKTNAKPKDKPKKPRRSKPRIHLIDELRGFAIFCMVFYHAFYTVGVLFNIGWAMVLLNFFTPAEPYFAGLFILISGLACNLSHSNLERGVKLGFISLGVTLVTYLVLGTEYMISFGILHMLSICMILYGLIGKYLLIIPIWLGAILNVLIFTLLIGTQDGTFGVPYLIAWEFPKEWYSTNFLFIFGFPNKSFVSADYFPLLPWVFMFFCGAFIGRLIPKKKLPKWMAKKHIPPLAFVGRHALLFYLAHQPLIILICYLVKWVMAMFMQTEPQ